MGKLKKIGANIDLYGMIIHKVNKSAGERKATVKHADNTIVCTEREKKFIATVFRSYFDNHKPIYGIFADEFPKFKNELEEYVKKLDLLEFSQTAATEYKNVIKQSAPATGGFLIFAHFLNTKVSFEYVLVLTITNKDGFMINENELTLKDVKNIDLSKIDVACMINLSKWEAIENGENTDSSTYLSFSEGNKEVSAYFLNFIDCDNKTTKTDSTNRFLKALADYLKEGDFDREEYIRKRNEIFDYATDRLAKKQPIYLSGVSALLNPENPRGFEKFAANEVYGVSPIVNADKARLKPLKYVRYKDTKMTVEFDAALLGKEVFFDAEKNRLTFVDLPDKLVRQIPK